MKVSGLIRGGILTVLLAVFIPVYARAYSQPICDDYALLSALCSQDNYVDSIGFQLDSAEMTVDGRYIPIDPEQNGVTPEVINGRTMLPARALVEALNGSIRYENGCVTIEADDGTQIELVIGASVMYVDGAAVDLDAAAQIFHGRTYLPVRSISESLSCEVDWNSSSRQVTITQPCQTRRLVVRHQGRLPETFPTHTMNFSSGLRILAYDTVEETRQALLTLEHAGICVYPDVPVEIEPQEFSGGGWEDELCGMSWFAQKAGNRPITVAVIDSGINSALPVFDGRLEEGFDFVLGKAGVSEDAMNHGTPVSSLIAQYTPDNVRILPIRVFKNSQEIPYLSTLVAAVSYAQQSGADLVNMSLSMLKNDATAMFTEQVQKMIDNGICVVCSAGNHKYENDVKDSSRLTPAGIEDAIVVAATNKYNRPAFFSNYGHSVDLAAPGEGVTSIGRGGRTEIKNGTSFAAPLVTSACAVLLTCQDYLPAELEQIIHSSTVPFPNSNEQHYGVGILNLYTQEEEEPEEPQMPQEPELIAYRYGYQALRIAVGNRCFLDIFEVYSDGSTREITAAGSLYSTNPEIISIEPDGAVRAVKAGTALVSLSGLPNGISIPEPVVVEVVEPSITLSCRPVVQQPHTRIEDMSLVDGWLELKLSVDTSEMQDMNLARLVGLSWEGDRPVWDDWNSIYSWGQREATGTKTVKMALGDIPPSGIVDFMIGLFYTDFYSGGAMVPEYIIQVDLSNCV